MSTQQTMVSIHYLGWPLYTVRTNCQVRYVCDTTDKWHARTAAYDAALDAGYDVINDVTWTVPSDLADTSVRLGYSTRVG
jgi:hypothetical protein